MVLMVGVVKYGLYGGLKFESKSENWAGNGDLLA